MDCSQKSLFEIQRIFGFDSQRNAAGISRDIEFSRHWSQLDDNGNDITAVWTCCCRFLEGKAGWDLLMLGERRVDMCEEPDADFRGTG